MLIAYGMLIDDCRLGLADWLIIVVPNPKSKIQNPKSENQQSTINNQQFFLLVSERLRGVEF
jgi:hypothetical protein